MKFKNAIKSSNSTGVGDCKYVTKYATLLQEI